MKYIQMKHCSDYVTIEYTKEKKIFIRLSKQTEKNRKTGCYKNIARAADFWWAIS